MGAWQDPRRRTSLILALVLSLAVGACANPQEKQARAVERGKALFSEGETVKAALEFRTALQIDPVATEPMFYLGLIAEEQGDLQAAFGQFTKVTEQDPRHVRALTKIGQIALMGGYADKAAEQADAILALEPSSAEGHALLGAVLLRRGQLAEAEAEVARSHAGAPGNVAAASVLAGIRVQQGRLPAAIALLDDSLKMHPRDEGLLVVKLSLVQRAADTRATEEVLRQLVEAKPANNTYKANLARFLSQGGRAAEAEAVFRTAMEAEPDDKALKFTFIGFLMQQRGTAVAEEELWAMSAAAPKDNAFRFALADLYERAGRRDTATGILKGIAEKAGMRPDGLKARAALAHHAFAAGRIDETRTLLAEVFAEDASRADALLVRANLAMRDGNFLDAVTDLRTALRSEPRSKPVLLTLAHAHIGRREPELALDAYQAFLEVDPGNIAVRTEMARHLMAMGQNAEAGKQLAVILSSDPADVPAQLARIDLLITQKSFAEAEATARRLVDGAKPTDVDARASGHAALGKALGAQGRFADAIVALKAALALTPGAPEPQMMLASAYLESGQGAAARDFAQSLIAQRPDDATAYVLLGDVQQSLGNLADAEDALRQASARQPDWALPALKLGRLYDGVGKGAAAAAAFRAGLSRNPGHLELLQQLAVTEDGLDNHEAARQAYEAVLAKAPEDAVAGNNLAALIADAWPTDTPLLEKARQLAERSRNATNPLFIDTLGWVQYRLGNTADAVALLEAAARRAPENAQIRYHLGMAYRARGDLENAHEQLTRAVAPGADYRGLDEARRVLAAR